MARFFCFTVLFFGIVRIIPAAPVPAAPIDPTKDREGNPLPKGTTARLGSLSYRGTTTAGLTFSKDGKRLYSVQHDRVPRWDAESGEKKPAPQNGRLLVWQADTGRLISDGPFEPPVPANSAVSSCVAGDRIVTLVFQRVIDDNDKKKVDYSMKVVLSGIPDGKEIAHFEYPNLPEGAWREYDLGDAKSRSAFRTSAVSPDGRYLVFSERNGVLVFDLNREKLSHSIATSRTPMGICISSDSKTLFVSNEGQSDGDGVQQPRQSVSRYELVSGKALPEFAEDDCIITSLAISPDSKRAIANGFTVINEPKQPGVRRYKEEGVLFVRDMATGKSTGKLPIGGTIHSFQFVDADSALVTYATTGTLGATWFIARWNTATLKREWESELPRGLSMASEDYQEYDRRGRRIRVYSTVPFEISPDGKQFSLRGGHVIFVGDAATGKPVLPKTAHTGPVKWIAFSSDGKTVTTAGGEELFVWATDGERKQLVELPELSRSRGRFLTGSSGDHLIWFTYRRDDKQTEIVSWDRDKRQIAWRMPYKGSPPENVFSHDGKRVVVLDWDEQWEDWQASVYDGAKGKLIDDWTVPYMPPKSHAVQALQELENQLRSTDGPGPGFGGRGGKGAGRGPGPQQQNGIPYQAQQKWAQLSNTIQLTERTGPNWCHPITLSEDGSTIFVAGSKVVALDSLTGKKKNRLDRGSLDPSLASEGSLASSADGALLAIGDSHSLRVVESKTGKVLMQQEGYSLHKRMKFSPDGKQLAVWYEWQSMQLSLYDVQTNAKPRVLNGGLSSPTCCAFNSTGTSLSVGYEDGTALIWDLGKK